MIRSIKPQHALTAFKLFIVSACLSYAAVYIQKKDESSKIIQKAEDLAPSYEWGRFASSMQDFCKTTSVTQYLVWEEVGGDKRRRAGTSGLVNISSGGPSLNGTITFVDEIPAYGLSIITVFGGTWSFLFEMVGWMVMFLAPLYFAYYVIISRRNRDLYDFFRVSIHEISEDLGVLSKNILFKLRCNRAVGLLVGEDLPEYTPLLKDLVDIWIDCFAKNIRVRKKFDFDSSLRVYDQPLSIIVTNVLKNAVKHTTQPDIELSIVLLDNQLVIKVKNLTESILSKESQRAMQGRTSRKGLFIVRSFLSYLGSPKPKFTFLDRGTAVSVSLPLKKIEAPSNNSQLMFEPRVAILDDHHDVLISLEKSLRGAGCSVEKFAHIDDLFLDLTKRPLKFHIIITDKHGENYKNRPNWDAEEYDLAGFARSVGFNGKLVMYSSAGSTLPGYDRVLDKGLKHDWNNEIGKLLS